MLCRDVWETPERSWSRHDVDVLQTRKVRVRYKCSGRYYGMHDEQHPAVQW